MGLFYCFNTLRDKVVGGGIRIFLLFALIVGLVPGKQFAFDALMFLLETKGQGGKQRGPLLLF